jgi:Bacterial Ig-like domain (group 2)
LSDQRPLAIYLSACLLLLLACANATVIDDSCFVDLAPITARANAVSVGDTVTFEASLGPAECLPSAVDSEDWRWSSTDTLIARIDSLTGLALGVSPGAVLIQVRHALDLRVTSATGFEVVSP